LRFLLFSIRFPFVLAWLISCLVCVAVVYPFVSVGVRNAMNHHWSRALMFLCGVKVNVLGNPTLQGSALWVANHVSWIDIYVLASVRCVAFIAKSEIRDWPVIGWLVAKVGTIFVNRSQRNSVRQVGTDMQKMFDQGLVIGLFAEGTTSRGFDVLPFHSSLFEPPVRAEVTIQPVALRFFHKGQRSDYLAFVGNESLIHNLWVLLGTTGAMVEVEFMAPVPAEKYKGGRAGVADYVREEIRKAVTRGLEPGVEEQPLAA
jgi:1-acyl-sn-glycerol-3-phosphate acyltransferase